ncbi:MAG: peptide chain release factor N(5)-glutamine methyltransferase [Acidobacteria bacterium]|nr:peptide chain release factor N(5)-glutamine methyltransferase [Acidobacteriota bacterium]
MTIADCTRDAVAVLAQAGFPRDDSQRDVAVLARHVLGWDAAAWLTRQRDEAPASLMPALALLVARRASGEPVAYLVGEKEFYGRAFTVTAAVLIPRPETELLVERALAILAHRPAGTVEAAVVDVGTGSGCIAVTLAAEYEALGVRATDVSADALAIAARNAARHDVTGRVVFVHGGFTAGATAVDLVVSNPPYIAESDRDRLMRDIRDFEPAPALFAGARGLDVIDRLVPDAFRALRPGGTLLLEIGAGQSDAVAARLAAVGFTALATHADLSGIPRVVEGTRPPASV